MAGREAFIKRPKKVRDEDCGADKGRCYYPTTKGNREKGTMASGKQQIKDALPSCHMCKDEKKKEKGKKARRQDGSNERSRNVREGLARACPREKREKTWRTPSIEKGKRRRKRGRASVKEEEITGRAYKKEGTSAKDLPPQGQNPRKLETTKRGINKGKESTDRELVGKKKDCSSVMKSGKKRREKFSWKKKSSHLLRWEKDGGMMTRTQRKTQISCKTRKRRSADARIHRLLPSPSEMPSFQLREKAVP